jgi:hypothetical protein
LSRLLVISIVLMVAGSLLASWLNCAQAIPDGYKSIFYMESECTAPGVPNLQPCQGLKNVAFNIGTATELGIMVLVPKGSDAPRRPIRNPTCGQGQP